MAAIVKRINSNNEETYKVSIRIKGTCIYKTFYNEEDANLYAKWKENLLNNMENFDVKLNEIITLNQIIDLKKKTEGLGNKTYADLDVARKYFNNIFGDEKPLSEISYYDWLEASKKLLETYVYLGAVKEHNKRKMSTKTLKRNLACISSAISNAQNLGVNLQNHPLNVIRGFVNKLEV